MRASAILCIVLLSCPLISSVHAQSLETPASPSFGEWTTWTVADVLPENEVRAVFQDSQGRLWFGTRHEGIGMYDGASWAYFTSEDGLAANGILALNEDDNGRIWAAGGAGYSLFDGSTWAPHDSLGALHPRVIYSINVGSEGHVWLGANGGASAFDGARWRHFTEADGLPHRVVHAALEDRSGTRWFACREGLARLSESEMTVLYPEDNFGSILEDGRGHLWFGTRGSGAYQFDGQDWIQHLPGRDARPTLVDREGNVWAVSDENGVYRYDGAAWTRYGVEDGLVSNTVFDVTEAQDGSLWFATAAGVSRFDP